MSSQIKSIQVIIQETSKQEGETHTRWKINRKLLPLKMYYFFFYGASGSFIPFITVYLKHLRLSASEAGIITGLSMLFAMLLRALIAMLADRLSARKTALLICCLGFGLSFFSMWFIPHRILPLEPSTNYSSGRSVAQQHQQDNIDTWTCWTETGQEICSYPASLNSCWCRIADSKNMMNMTVYHRRDAFGAFQTDEHDFNVSDIQRHQAVNSTEYTIDIPHLDLNDKVNQQKNTKEIFYEFNDHSVPCFYIDCESEPVKTSPKSLERLEDAAVLQFKDQDIRTVSSPAGNLHHRNPSYETSRTGHSTVTCLLNCTRTQMTKNTFHRENPGHELLNVTEEKRSLSSSHHRIIPDLAFSLSFLLLITGKSLYSASTSLIDAVTYTILGPYSLKWGQQRLWGTIGTGVIVLSITVVNDSRQVESFSGLFIGCMGLSILAFLIGLFKLRADKIPKNKMFFSDLKKLLSSGAVRLFLVKLLFYGIMAGTAQNFIFWFLVDIGSAQITLGVCLLLYCVASVIILRCSRLVLRKLGQIKVMYLTLVAYAIRYLVLSFLTNPWMALPVEVLHGVTYSLFWAAASSTASMVAPPGTQASSQGLAGAMYWDLGRGIGIVIAGQLLHLFGARWTFRVYSLLCVAVLPVLWILDRTWTLQKLQFRQPDDDKDTQEDSKNDFLSCMEIQEPKNVSAVDDKNAHSSDVELAHTQQTCVDNRTLHSEETTTVPVNSFIVLCSNDVYTSDQVSVNNSGSHSTQPYAKLSENKNDDSVCETGNISISVQILETGAKQEYRADASH
ncbi:unnamed protein product [Candidula unifasciata]|uniref:Major facilitator superfamily associated domain-containing protein n=1 Tax=Candidula unifasciata TaxID=100452 RepID=A0A8S3Z2E0_9EUPU|nr:unnamed protein product [Candidula unifasciata]